ncbi:MAG: aldehyde dehydrogenase family protein [Actinobacteria bacterium]|nr:aldehyde dehydrogenase family protein [Actinomycetota bacterium]
MSSDRAKARTETVEEVRERLGETFESGRTTNVVWRERQLKAVITLVEKHEKELTEAMAADLGKPAFEGWLTDLLTTRDEAKYALKHLDDWMKATKHAVPSVAQPGKAWTQSQPLGTVLVIAPWNYPVQLLLSPLVGALAAGNTVVLKPSELAPATSAVLAELVPQHLDPDAVAVVEGGVDVTTELLDQPWDHILFTGSTRVGQVVMEAAAKHLTPVTLELGGKSPTIVAGDADLKVAARRIAWAKWLNAGQTCVAPDYVLVEEHVADTFTRHVVEELASVRDRAEPTSIVNSSHLARLEGLLDGHGGEELLPRKVDADSRTFAPVVVREPDLDSPLMQEEIFGPILPIVSVESVADAVKFVNKRPRPLALYVFSESGDTSSDVLWRTTSGSACVNHAVYQVAIPSMPFGGVGPSGMGAYHGKAGFDTFSHTKSILRRPTKGDMKVAYAPYSGMVQKVMRMVTRWPSR